MDCSAYIAVRYAHTQKVSYGKPTSCIVSSNARLTNWNGLPTPTCTLSGRVVLTGWP